MICVQTKTYVHVWQQKFGLVSLFNGISTYVGFFNAEGIILEER